MTAQSWYCCQYASHCSYIHATAHSSNSLNQAAHLDQQRFNSCTVKVYQASPNATKLIDIDFVVCTFVAVDIDIVVIVAVWKLVKAWAWAYCNTGVGVL